jgi:hypothetical protein
MRVAAEMIHPRRSRIDLVPFTVPRKRLGRTRARMAVWRGCERRDGLDCDLVGVIDTGVSATNTLFSTTIADLRAEHVPTGHWTGVLFVSTVESNCQPQSSRTNSYRLTILIFMCTRQSESSSLGFEKLSGHHRFVRDEDVVEVGEGETRTRRVFVCDRYGRR